jgi:hypothetical protein
VVGRVGRVVLVVVVGRVGGIVGDVVVVTAMVVVVGRVIVGRIVVVTDVEVVPPTWARVGPGSEASMNQTAPVASSSPRRAAERRRGAHCSATGRGPDDVPPPVSGAMPSRRNRRPIGYRRVRAVKVEVPRASRAWAPCRRATATAVVAASMASGRRAGHTATSSSARSRWHSAS